MSVKRLVKTLSFAVLELRPILTWLAHICSILTGITLMRYSSFLSSAPDRSKVTFVLPGLPDNDTEYLLYVYMLNLTSNEWVPEWFDEGLVEADFPYEFYFDRMLYGVVFNAYLKSRHITTTRVSNLYNFGLPRWGK